MQAVTLFYLLAGLLPFSAWAADLPEKVLRFEISVGKETELAKGGMAIISDIFAKHGFRIQFEELPLQRGLEELQRGRLDGAAGRTANLKERFKLEGYERLEDPITYTNSTLWCHKTYRNAEGKRKLKLAYLRGSVVATFLVQHIDRKTSETLAVNSFRSAANMLVSKRVDCMLAFQRTFEDDLKGAFDLKDIVPHVLIKHGFYIWIAAHLLPFKNALDHDLRNYSFPKDWAEKYRNPQLPCGKQLEVICPDGLIFARP